MKIFAISEQAMPTKLDILEESTAPGFGPNRIKFKARLQTANVPNNNKRIYPTETLQEVFNQLKPKVDEGKLLGELDHPQIMTSDKNGQLKRSSTILLQNACVHFLEMSFDGTHIDAIAQTTTNRAGLDAYAFIKDGVTVGFSLRAFGELEKTPEGYSKVPPRGLKAITYDLVAMPSHSNALILEILNESEDPLQLVKELKSYEESLIKVANDHNMKIIEEATITESAQSSQVCANGICSLRPIEETIDYLTELALQSKKVKSIKLKLK